ncbi:MAG: carboxypeptidase-like regulatory domain-containing protein, partial [Acidobacteriota bacterium]|nr:carboxypeptidase-like regulatory domain-containing protein [Acidobacteriota bacterium]
MKAKGARTILRSLLPPALACVFALGGVVSIRTGEGQSVDTSSTKIPPNSITGRVVTASGEPVTNATVSVTRMNAPSPSRPSPAGADGSFVVSGLEPGVYRVTASAPSYIQLDPESSRAETHRVGDSVTITLIKGGVINGKVRDSEGQPVVGVRVRALLVKDADGQPAAGVASVERVTDDRGVYRLYGLQPGTYVVSAGGDGTSGGAGARVLAGAGGRGGFAGGLAGLFGGAFGGGTNGPYSR